ncbi:hypothetical protein [Roseimaritima sediminicola]|uniref:hypothetical protein n=1 Tax=Roseimaritima sediminicola TaxID=2662066 RepID=UPI00129827C9|nr:hypothetical protein [Roseimaritima sediminicola]
MSNQPNFEQQLSALQPAASETDPAVAMYRCGFAAGQAAAAKPSRAGRESLRLLAAACVTAVLVGPLAYRWGDRPARPSPAPLVAATESPVVDPPQPDAMPVPSPQAEGLPNMPQDTNRRVARVEPDVASRPPALRSSPAPRQPPTSVLGLALDPVAAVNGWLTPPAQRSVVATRLTSRPPSADTIEDLQRWNPPRAQHRHPSRSLPQAPEPPAGTRETSEDPLDRTPFPLTPLPSRRSLDSWQSWM